MLRKVILISAATLLLLGVAATRGPWGLPKGIEDTKAWLEEFKDSGQEPAPILAKEKKEKEPAAK